MPARSSATSSSSSAKQPLLQFYVTPPKPAGPCEAEKKIEDLTRQLEEQADKKEMELENFGEKSVIQNGCFGTALC